MGRAPRLLASKVSTPDNFHPQNLINSFSHSTFAERIRAVSARFGKCHELHLRLELPYERGPFVDRHACADHRVFCFWADAGGENQPAPLSQLLAEAGANNPQISAANYGVRAARQMAPQVTTLPDPKFTYQQLSVGSPKPFAGYTNSDFTYIGIGASQELPYPGKLRRSARSAVPQAEVKLTKTSIADAVKAVSRAE